MTTTLVGSGSTDSGFTASAGSTLEVLSGGVANATTVTSGGNLYVAGGLASGAAISGGGHEVVFSGGLSSATTVFSGGTELVSSGSTANGTIVSSGGFADIYGTVNATVVSSGGHELVYSGATTTSATVSAGGVEDIFAGATANGDIVAGGIVIVTSGGITNGTTVSSAGRELISSGGVGSFDVVATGGSEILLGGLSDGVTIMTGAAENVSAGGETTNALVSSGGVETLFSGGTSVAGEVFSGGVERVSSGGSASGLTVGSGGTEVIYAGGTATGTMLQTGGTIDLVSLAYKANGTATLDAATDTLTIVEGGNTYKQVLAGSYTGEYFHTAIDGGFGTVITVDTTPCYCRGTAILTERGEIAVEDLQIGDRLITNAGHARPIRWIGRRSYAGRFAAGNRAVLPVQISAGALADAVPKRDLFVSPLHALYLDGVLIAAGDLVNGSTIRQLAAVDRVDYVHVELETHDVILAEGAPAETFVDDHSRAMFHNVAEYAALHPDAPTTEAIYCAPRVTAGAALEAVRRRLAARAAATTAPERRAG